MDLTLFDDLRERLNLGGLGRPALFGVVAVIVVVAVAVGFRLFGTATATEFQVASASPSESASAEEMEPSSAAPETLFVHVSGEVKNPGLCEVDSGARVAAAIEAAGGFTDEAAIDSVNLAREVVDGEQVIVGRKISEEDPSAASASAFAQSAAPSAAPSADATSGLVNINKADEGALKSLPGIGDAIAAKIIADRQANGPFKAIDDLKRVPGIGDKKFDALSGLICV